MSKNLDRPEEPDDSWSSQTLVLTKDTPRLTKEAVGEQHNTKKLGWRKVAMTAAILAGAYCGFKTASNDGNQLHAQFPPDAVYVGKVEVQGGEAPKNFHIKPFRESLFAPFLAAFDNQDKGIEQINKPIETDIDSVLQDPTAIEAVFDEIIKATHSGKHFYIVGAKYTPESIRSAIEQVRPQLTILVEGGAIDDARVVAEKLYMEAIAREQPVLKLAYVSNAVSSDTIKVHAELAEQMVIESHIEESTNTFLIIIIALVLAGWLGQGYAEQFKQYKEDKTTQRRFNVR